MEPSVELHVDHRSQEDPGNTGTMGWLPMLVPPLAALLCHAAGCQMERQALAPGLPA
jgi:hypothetical protein